MTELTPFTIRIHYIFRSSAKNLTMIRKVATQGVQLCICKRFVISNTIEASIVSSVFSSECQWSPRTLFIKNCFISTEEFHAQFSPSPTTLSALIAWFLLSMFMWHWNMPASSPEWHVHQPNLSKAYKNSAGLWKLRLLFTKLRIETAASTG